jgi:hypothetical protein
VSLDDDEGAPLVILPLTGFSSSLVLLVERSIHLFKSLCSFGAADCIATGVVR